LVPLVIPADAMATARFFSSHPIPTLSMFHQYFPDYWPMKRQLILLMLTLLPSFRHMPLSLRRLIP
jgi:hypothetical protein